MLCCAELLQSFLTLCNLMDCNLPGSSVPGILQAIILEWVAMPSSRGPSLARDWTYSSCASCIAGRFFTVEPPGKPYIYIYIHIYIYTHVCVYIYIYIKLWNKSTVYPKICEHDKQGSSHLVGMEGHRVSEKYKGSFVSFPSNMKNLRFHKAVCR